MLQTLEKRKKDKLIALVFIVFCNWLLWYFVYKNSSIKLFGEMLKSVAVSFSVLAAVGASVLVIVLPILHFIDWEEAIMVRKD